MHPASTNTISTLFNHQVNWGLAHGFPCSFFTPAVLKHGPCGSVAQVSWAKHQSTLIDCNSHEIPHFHSWPTAVPALQILPTVDFSFLPKDWLHGPSPKGLSPRPFLPSYIVLFSVPVFVTWFLLLVLCSKLIWLPYHIQCCYLCCGDCNTSVLLTKEAFISQISCHLTSFHLN